MDPITQLQADRQNALADLDIARQEASSLRAQLDEARAENERLLNQDGFVWGREQQKMAIEMAKQRDTAIAKLAETKAKLELWQTRHKNIEIAYQLAIGSMSELEAKLEKAEEVIDTFTKYIFILPSRIGREDICEALKAYLALKGEKGDGNP